MADKMWDILRFLKSPEDEKTESVLIPPEAAKEKEKTDASLIEALSREENHAGGAKDKTLPSTPPANEKAPSVSEPAPETVPSETQPENVAEADERLIDIPLSRIVPNPFQPRKLIGEEEMIELSDSIKELGVLQPVIVRKSGEKYELIAGERRFRAAERAGLSRIPAVVMQADPVRQQVIALVENIQRKNLSSIEEARCLRDIMAATGWSQTEMARRLGRSQAAVANKIRLLKLDDSVQELVIAGKLGERQARSLLSLSLEEQSALAQKAIDEDLSARVLETLAESWQNRNDPRKRSKQKTEQETASGPAGELLHDLASLVNRHKTKGVPAQWKVKQMDQSSLIVEIYVDLSQNKSQHNVEVSGGGE